MIKIIIEDDIVRELEALSYKCDVRKDIIDYMIDNNITINFEYYHRKYLNVINSYNKRKKDFEREYVKKLIPNAKHWSLDFTTGEVEID